MKRVKQFGETVEGYNIPVLNEREIRASAGILFLLMFISIMFVAFENYYGVLKFSIVIFFTDFIIRVFVNPKYSPTLIIGKMIVRNQVPEYVGAPQKRFAWMIGVMMSATMFVAIGLLNWDNLITSLFCHICLWFLFFESAFGICIGCKIYANVYQEKAQYCPGEVCEIQERHEIQKTSRVQKIIILGFVTYIFLIIFLFNGYLAS